MKLGAIVSACICVAILVATTSSASRASSTRTTACTYKLGTLLPLTGAVAYLGTADLVGATAAIKDINSHGGVKGCKLQLITADTTSTTSVAVTRLQSLIDDGIYGLVGPQPGSDSLAVAPILQQAKIPACVLSSTISVTQQNNPYVFRCQASDIISVQGAILFAKTKLKAKNVALLHTDDAYGTQAAAAFVQAASSGKTQINLTANLPLSYTGTDFTAEWSRALASHPDAVIVWATGAPAAIILRNAQQLGVNVPIIGGSGMTGASIAPAGSAANGLYATNLFDPTHPTKLQQHAISVMQSLKGSSYQPSLFELLAWDDVHVFAAAIAAHPNNALLGMESIHHLTLTEGTYTFGPTNRNALGVSSLVITQVKNGTAVGVATGKSLLGK